MDATPTRIPVRSRRKAMDWSLVLLSQGIQSTVLPKPEGEGWELLVDPPHQTAALAALRQYQVENRGWSWPPATRWPVARFDWSSLVWAALLAYFHWLASARPGIVTAGVMDSAAVAAGQWWRVFTAMQLHADVGHLAANLSIGVLLLGLVMGRFGLGVGMLATYAAGIGGNLLSLTFNHKPFHGLGASGMVMGALGLLAAQSFAFRSAQKVPPRLLFGGIMAGIMLFVLFGLSPGSDLAAHFGGFVSGLALGFPLAAVPVRRIRGLALSFFAGLICAALVTATWWLALSHL